MLTIYEQEAARLRQLLKEKTTLSNKKFAETYGLGTAGNFWHYTSGRRHLNARVVSIVAKALGVEVEEISPRLAKEIDSLKGSSNVSVIEPKEVEARRKKIPLVSSVHAGELTDPGDLTSDEFIESFGDHPDGCFALRVEGDSMTPVFDHGDYVIVDPSRAVKVGCYVVARSELSGIAEATLKQYFEVDFDNEGRSIFELRPLNSMYSSLHSVRHKLHILGVVTELIKRF